MYHISKRKLNVNIVRENFIKKGLTPCFNDADYKSNMSKLAFICPNHKDKDIQYVQYARLNSNKYLCYYCCMEHRGDYIRCDQERVFNDLIHKGLMPLEGEAYINKDRYIRYTCVKHPNHIQQITYGGFKRTKVACDLCRIDNSLQKLSRILRSSIAYWKQQSKNAGNDQCMFTGDAQYEIHHIIPFDQIIKETLNVLSIAIKNKYSADEIILIKNKFNELHLKYPLGICMHVKIHQLLHKLYSKQSSEIDFNNFKIRLNNGEFDDYLYENNLKRIQNIY
jgi:predicted RNA-binding Zn-ribbon protein involved in translation (DUF1610 family)